MSYFIEPKKEIPKLSFREIEDGIKFIKDTFETELASVLNLKRVSAPLYVTSDSGLNDDLDGKQKAISFNPSFLKGKELQIVHSLAKWKRSALKRYAFGVGEGLYTDMNATRKDEIVGNFHSIYVDQWDWELVMTADQRNEKFLKQIVTKIFGTLKKTEKLCVERFPLLGSAWLPETIHFISSRDLLKKYPNLSPKERENEAAAEHGAIFLMHIGSNMGNEIGHDSRAPDYDDWSLNGDIIVHYPPLGCALELSSMGIRVDAASMKKQCEEANVAYRLKLPFHEKVLNNSLPLTIGGGIGQSRLCLYFLKRGHIGEVQSSIWDTQTHSLCEKHRFFLL